MVLTTPVVECGHASARRSRRPGVRGLARAERGLRHGRRVERQLRRHLDRGLKDLGQASTGTKLPLELGMIANQSGIASAVKSASNPTSSSFGKYLSISSLQSKYGASSSRRKAVVGAFSKYNAKATADVFHLRVVTTITIGTAQKMFGTHWHVYLNNSTGAKTALPVNTPSFPPG